MESIIRLHSAWHAPCHSHRRYRHLVPFRWNAALSTPLWEMDWRRRWTGPGAHQYGRLFSTGLSTGFSTRFSTGFSTGLSTGLSTGFSTGLSTGLSTCRVSESQA